MTLEFETANKVWLGLLERLVRQNAKVSPRGKETRELLACQSVVDMRWPIITLASRKLGYRFMAAEAAWILSGDNRVETIEKYSSQIAKFSDDGVFFFGAYGPKVVEQLTYVVDILVKDLDSRQAVIGIWRERPRESKDIPCTLSLQFLVRDRALNTIATMRSSDAWLGVPYDWFNFTAISTAIILMYEERGGIKLTLGNLYFNAGSQHLYEENLEGAKKILELGISDERFEVSRPWSPHRFEGYASLRNYLWLAAEKDGKVELKDL